MRPIKRNDFKGSLCLFKCYKTCFTEYKVPLVTEIKGFFRFWSIPSGALVSTDTFPLSSTRNTAQFLSHAPGNKGINQNKAWYCNAMRTFREWMWHPPPLFHTAVYFIYRKMDGGSVTGGNSHLLSEKAKRDHLHHFHKDGLENAFP